MEHASLIVVRLRHYNITFFLVLMYDHHSVYMGYVCGINRLWKH